MNLQEYQKAAMRTAGAYNTTLFPADVARLASVLCLAGEVGELANIVKKQLFHGYGSRLDDRVQDELGDILWYVARICEAYNLQLEDIAEQNIEKLSNRYPDGFSQERSLNRNE